MKKDTINLRINHSVKLKWQQEAKKQNLTLSKYLLKLNDENTVKSIIKNLESISNSIALLKLANQPTAEDEANFDLRYALNLSKKLAEILEDKVPVNPILKALRNAKK